MAGRKTIPDEQKKGRTSFSGKYPIKYYIGAVPIREVNVISIYIDEKNMVAIAKTVENSSMSIAKALAYSGQPCTCCKNTGVSILHKGQSVIIPRGLLVPKKQNSGNPLTKRKHHE